MVANSSTPPGDEEPSSPPSPDSVTVWLTQLREGDIEQKRRAVEALVELRAESVLVSCLRMADAVVNDFAAAGLWEIWLSERGREARESIDDGIRALNRGKISQARDVFRYLMVLYPDWAEPANKLAMLFFFIDRPADTLELCQRVVALKPNHFAAWNSMAMAAIQIRDWETAKLAAEWAVKLFPGSGANRELLRIVSEPANGK